MDIKVGVILLLKRKAHFYSQSLEVLIWNLSRSIICGKNNPVSINQREATLVSCFAPAASLAYAAAG